MVQPICQPIYITGFDAITDAAAFVGGFYVALPSRELVIGLNQAPSGIVLYLHLTNRLRVAIRPDVP